MPSHLSDHISCSCLLSKASLAPSLGGFRLERSILYGPGVLELALALLQLLALISVLQTGLPVHLGDLIRALRILKVVRTRGGLAETPAAAGAKCLSCCLVGTYSRAVGVVWLAAAERNGSK